MNKSKQITDGALLTAVYIVLFLVIFFIPILQVFGFFVLPIPFAIYAARYGWKPAVVMAVVMAIVAFILTALFATIVALPMTIFSTIGGIIIGNGIYKKKNAYENWARGTVGYIISFVIVLAVLQLFFSINIFTEINTVIDDMMAMMRSVTSQLPLGEDAESQLTFIEDQMRQFPDLLPSSIIIMSILFALLTQWMSYKVISRIEREKQGFPPFKQLDFPIAIIWLYFLAFLVSFLNLEQGSTMDVIIINARSLLTVLLIIQGFSFIFFFTDHKKIHKAVPIGVVIVTLLIPFIFMFLIEITGIIDLGFSLKKRIKESKS